ncbi:MAG TPA: universal stress protein, partial [Ilumatobacter sp.]
MSTYVVGIDGSQTAAKAAARAGALAKATGAAVHVVSAFTGHRTTTVTVGSDEFDVSDFNTAEQVANQQASTFKAMGIDATYAA